jgi:hypothetical protein
LDLPHCHAASVEAQYLVVEPIEAGLALGDQLWLETAGAVVHRNLDLTVVGQDRLWACAIAAVAATAAGRVALFVAQMVGQLGAERTLDQGLLELFEKSILSRQVFGLLIVSK